MSLRPSTTRTALWVFVAALLLRAAMPFLATLSADLQGRAVAEVCSVYGVAKMPMDGAMHGHAPESMPDHGGVDHCPLTALAMLGTPSLPTLVAAPAPAWDGAARCRRSSQAAHDACAAWVARLQHGPPAVT